jgi:hypothetical protein
MKVSLGTLFIAAGLAFCSPASPAQQARLVNRDGQGCAPGGQRVFAVSNNSSKALTVTIKVLNTIGGKTTPTQQVVYLPAGGEQFVGCTIDGPGPYAYRKYQIVGIQAK